MEFPMIYRSAHRSTLIVAAGVVFSLINFAPRLALADDQVCVPTLESPRIDFPADLQRLGVHGTVHARVRIGAAGQAEDAGVAVSSGFAALDRAALDSIRKYWRFNVAQCGAPDPKQQYIVRVRFEQTKTVTASGTLDTRAIAKTAELRAQSNCNANDVSSDTTVFSCIDTPLRSDSTTNLSAAK
jgi:TonB family protein